MLEPGYAYIRITNFQAKTTKDMKKVLKDLAKEEEIKGLVLDLRNNPGGLLDQAVKVSRRSRDSLLPDYFDTCPVNLAALESVDFELLAHLEV